MKKEMRSVAMLFAATMAIAFVSCDGDNTNFPTQELGNDDDAVLNFEMPEYETRPLMPTERFAKYNVAPDGKSFVTTQSNDGLGYFSFDKAKDIVIEEGGKVYRTPNSRELRSLVSYNEVIYGKVGNSFHRQMHRELVQLGKESKWYKEYFYSNGRGVAYAIRFASMGEEGKMEGYPFATDDKQRVAFRYEFSKNKDSRRGYSLKITTRYLGDKFKGGMGVVTNEGFWKSYTKEDVTIELPAGGERYSHLGKQRPANIDAMGFYWSNERSNERDCAWSLGFGTSWTTLTIHSDIDQQMPVRLIADSNE